ncbi:DNA polymerase I [Candidatus Neomarinimicrobiota bacterium]
MSQKKNNRKRLYLIDGYAILYRAHFALIRNPLITKTGLNTSALFGFTNQLLSLLRQEEPDYIAAVFDTSAKTFRHKRYPEYKATREKMPEEMQTQLPYLWDILKALRIETLSKPGFEADDIIGTLAKKGQAEDIDVYIVSGDKDFMQLVNEHIYLYIPPGRGLGAQIIDHDGVENKWGVPPDKIIDLLGLMGDSSDNVPGVRGVGEKSAVKLLLEYGSLEESLNNAEKVTNKRIRNGLLEHREDALLSRELVTIDTAVDINREIADLVRNEFETDALIELFQKLEFSSLLSQIADVNTIPAREISKPTKDYNIIINTNQLKSFIRSIKPNKLLSIDLETTSVNPMLAEIVGLSFSSKSNSGFYIPINYLEKLKNNFGDDDLTKVLSKLKPIFENPEIPKTGQNIKYDALILARHGIQVNGIEFDTMIAAHLLNPASRSLKLDTLALNYLNYEMTPIEDLIGTGKNQISMAKVPLEDITHYAVEDADVTFQLTKIFQKLLIDEDLEKFFRKVELPLINVLIDMELNGTFADENYLNKMSHELGIQLEKNVKEILKTAGTEFNVNSTQQLAQILFDSLGLPQIRKRSTAEEVLERLKDKHPLPGLMLDYRKLNKLKNTYLDTFPDYIHPDTGRIHSNFSQTITATGRLSSSNPNFQNIPIRTDVGRQIRRAFRAQKKTWKIFSADYSQIELRIMAHLSRDPGLASAFKNGEDIHTSTASSIFGVAMEDVIPEMRRTAKIVNFAIMYGAGPYRMSQELHVPHNEAKHIIDTYFEKFSGINDYIQNTLEYAREKGYVKTMLGRKRPVWDIDSENRIKRDAAARMAINMPIQGTAAEMIKLAMISINRNMKQNDFGGSKLILQIHDELIFEVPENNLDELRTMVVAEMEKALPLSVPIVVDWGAGNSWYEAH